jgi:hypothetical protein
MRLAITAIAASIAWTSCSLAEPVRPVPMASGQSFSLKAGESAHSDQPALQLGFVAVTGDSRCPKGERCVVAGDATVRIWLRQGPGPMQTHELHAAPGAGQALSVGEHELRLLRLEPYAITGRAIAPADYVATFMLSTGAGAAPQQ